MGIRFFCPNGHKLHVKEFQAGRRGVCPYCGVDVDIPLASTRESSKGKSTSKRSEDAESVNLNAIAPDAAPDAVNGASFTSARQDREIELSAPREQPVVAPEPTYQAPAPKADPFEEAPNALWYVRPSSGGQYGPASAEIMKTWLDEGRINESSIVWREGWSDWKNAADVFEQITPTKIDLHLSGVINKQKHKAESSNQSHAAQPTTDSTSAINNLREQKAAVSSNDVPAIPSSTSFWKDYKLLAIIGEGLIIIGLIVALVIKCL